MADGGYHQEAKLQQDRARENIFISCFLFLLLLPVLVYIPALSARTAAVH
jgi:hypothetical protein